MDYKQTATLQKKREIAAIVDAPEIILTEDEKAGDVLLKFYRALGWNGEDILDPCKVRTTKSVYNQLYDLMCEKCPAPIAVGMAMVNKAPGIDDDIPPNKVYLLNNWISPLELRESGEE